MFSILCTNLEHWRNSFFSFSTNIQTLASGNSNKQKMSGITLCPVILQVSQKEDLSFAFLIFNVLTFKTKRWHTIFPIVFLIFFAAFYFICGRFFFFRRPGQSPCFPTRAPASLLAPVLSLKRELNCDISAEKYLGLNISL